MAHPRATWIQKNFTDNYSKDPYNAAKLLDSISQRNLADFRYALEVTKCDPNLVDISSGLSVFQTCLQTPNSSEFIKLCINNGAHLYKKSASNRYPIHFAIKSTCPENLRVFLKNYDPSKINLKYGTQNALHWIISSLLSSNYSSCCECIRILLKHGCNMNMPNSNLKTPFFMLLKKQTDINDDEKIVEYVLENYEVDFYTYRSSELLKMMEQQNPQFKLPQKKIQNISFDFMMDLINNRREIDFDIYFRAFKDKAGDKFDDYCLRFLEVTVANGMKDTVEFLLDQRVNVNLRSKEAKYSKPAAFIACSNGYFGILELLVKRPELKFSYNTDSQKFTLLHEVCQNFAMRSKENKNVNYQKCFDLIIKDQRCEINAEDDIGCSPLHYTVKYRNDPATIALLKKGAYINEESIFGKTPLDEISRSALETFLDECITTRDKKANDVTIDYNFLITPNRNRTNDSADKDGFCREISPLKRITENEELRSLVTHPVLSSFLFLKWSKLSFLFYTNLLIFSIFMMSFMYFIVLSQSLDVNERKTSITYSVFRSLSFSLLWVLIIRELSQLILSYKHYFTSLINWFEIALIALAWIIMTDLINTDRHARELRAVLILFAAFEFLNIVGNLPILSVSTHMVMLKRVTITFFKSIALYSILLLSFGLVFYSLYGEDKPLKEKKIDDDRNNYFDQIDSTKMEIESMESNFTVLNSRFNDYEGGSSTGGNTEVDSDFKTFRTPMVSILRVLVMLTGEFDATDMDLNSDASCIIFTIFVFLITIVLFNLLNALAVSDTAAIREKGELVDLIQRINVLESYEKIIFNEQSNTNILAPKLRAFISLFPSTIPHGKIIIRTGKNNEILTLKANQSSKDDIEHASELELRDLTRKSFRKIAINEDFLSKLQKYTYMSTDIVKKIRQILSSRDEKTKKQTEERKLRDDIENIKIQMELQLRLINEILAKNSND